MILGVMIFLMVCGCLYIREHFFAKETVVTNSEQIVVDNGDDMAETQQMMETETSQNEETEASEVEDKGVLVVLDAGHGGTDAGTFFDDVTEKEINIGVVFYMQELLEDNGVEVLLTRSTDDFISLSERTNIANYMQGDIFVSIHCNYYEDDSSVTGLETYYYPGTVESKVLAETLIDTLKANGNIKGRNAKAEELYVLNHTDMTAVLVELGYLSNITEVKNLTNDEYQKQLAEELVEGILEYIEVGNIGRR